MANTHSLDLELDSSRYAYAGDSVSLSITGDFTFEAWVKFESTPGAGGWYHILAKDSGLADTNRSYSWVLRNDTGLKMFAYVFNSAGNPDARYWAWTPTTGVWYHIAVTCDISQAVATELEFFVDGVSQGNGTASSDVGVTAINDSTVNFTIGARNNGLYFDGCIDEVRVWNDIRSVAEILANKDRELTGGEANLAAYWKLNNSYLDATANGNTLTAVNSPVFSTDIPFIWNDFVPKVIII